MSSLTQKDERLVRGLIREAAQQLREAGCISPESDAQWLLGCLLGKSPTELYLHEGPVSGEMVEVFERQVSERAQGKPLQYLIKSAHFYGASFIVEPGVFIPRPETEAVVAVAIRHLQAMADALKRPLKLVDVCAGSGCIAVTLARALPACTVTAIEVSYNAIFIASKNVQKYRLSARVQLVRGRWLEAVLPGGHIDGIVANPPYVPSSEINALPCDVRQEPRVSLDGGRDGLRDVRKILSDAPRVLQPGGVVILECGQDQVDLLIKEATWPWVARIDRIHDLAGRPRGLVIIRG